MIRYLLSGLLIGNCWAAAEVSPYDRIEQGLSVRLKTIEIQQDLLKDRPDVALYLQLRWGEVRALEVRTRGQKPDASPLALCNMGLYFIAQKDAPKALAYLLKAVDAGSSEAAYRIGRHLPNGKPWLEKAASMGHEKAHVRLLGAPKKQEDADVYFESAYVEDEIPNLQKAAVLGHQGACLRLAEIYVEKEDYANVDYYLKAADYSDFDIGNFYFEKTLYAQALPFYKAFADKFPKNAEANYTVGLCYKEGRGVARNLELAYGYFFRVVCIHEKTYQCGSDFACLATKEYRKLRPYVSKGETIWDEGLILYYRLPKTLEKLQDRWVCSAIRGYNYSHALYAAEMGHVGGQFYVGTATSGENNRFTFPIEDRLRYLKLAYDAGHEPAKQPLADVYFEYAQSHPEEEVHYLRLAIELGHTKACYRQAQIFESRGEVEQARALYEAAKKGWMPHSWLAMYKARKLSSGAASSSSSGLPITVDDVM